jgi:hypothetical protein
MSKDKWGYKSLCLTIKENGKDDKNFDLISYHYEENDSYTYITHDDMREIIVEIEPLVTKDIIKFVLEKISLTKDIKFALTKMLENNKICSGNFFVGNYK